VAGPVNGTLGEGSVCPEQAFSTPCFVKGFNPNNPHIGDAIIATFFWLGSTNVIDSVNDYLTTSPYSKVGNTYHLVEYSTVGGFSMATYVATNVQNFPDPNDTSTGIVLAVEAFLSQTVSDGGIVISSYSGVNPVFSQALGAHQSTSGTGTIADPGAISVGAKGLAYAVTMTSPPVGSSPVGAPFVDIGVGSDASIRHESEYAVLPSGGSVDPQWTYNSSTPWLATVFALNPAPAPAIDQLNGTLNENGRVLMQGFHPTNPHVGDAVVATFYWLGSTNIIDSVNDYISTTPYTKVGNTYHLVEYVTAGGISMATYVATNVQGFPDAGTAGDNNLAVAAFLSDSVSDGGLTLSAYTGVTAAYAQALGAHQSASGAGSSSTIADPGAIGVNARDLVYAVTMAAPPTGLFKPGAPFVDLGEGSDSFIKNDAVFSVPTSAGSIHPQWTWDFSSPSAWLATGIVLRAR
jgi:hypothetical protein